MFGESESESPRVPSPWDSLISVSTSPAANPTVVNSSPLATTAVIPKLVPEADDGNVEYKLQLLSPSPARFTRLVTQLKWRLLEGGGQAYYELGVADSGALVGLPRAQLEQSLETLEMMAGEIGASVIVVKEIEVPAAMAGLAVAQEDHRRIKKKDEFLSSGESSTTETETDTTDSDEDRVFAMDPEPVIIELEISSVFKPRPVRTKESNRHLISPEHRGKNKKHNGRKFGRERKKHENRKALSQDSERQVTIMAPASTTDEADALVSGLETLHVSLDQPQTVTLAPDNAIPSISLTTEPDPIDEGDDDDVFSFPTPSISNSTLVTNSDLVVPADEKRLIVEALVVRKMSIEEAFLDFGGFALV